MEQPQVPRRSKRSFPEPDSELISTGFGIIDILPLILCIGIVVLLYFLVREFQSEQENQEARYVSLARRLESLEKNEEPEVPAVTQKGSVWASSEAAETVERAQKNGTYVLKNSVVSFEPEEEEESLPPVVELPDEEDEDSDAESEDGAFN